MNDTPKRRTVLKSIASTGIATVGFISTLTDPSRADSTGDIPSHYLDQYRRTGDNWGFDWTYLAGVGWVETHHGQYVDGCAESSAGARGPMQFMPATWDAYGVDGDGDGDTDICDYRDAIPSAANYLTASGAPDNWDDALYAYNHSWNYVNHVKDTAAVYRDRYGSGGGGGFNDGDQVEPTTGLNTRHRPGVDSEILATMEPGTVGEIMNGPENKDGYTWWGVHWLDDDIWGWSVERYLTRA
ncbi:lytic transglycosylase domain-containing protein [Halocatena pleomorpha]|uniref:Lytic transglycosylase domain-containing protein n=1 Tax=Halocatena pleomorpha TaxID=1785090 RepID=A0A3P3R892_9EURY|nr:lytic transglycosylase domain-containing protein [Halocatena pleomorpha]RRJ29584.1 lytic transglycosylase domain-containing protein [Halocatena pleomorpha]